MADTSRHDSSIAQHLGGRITALRKSRHRTQAALPEWMEVDTETISRFQRGATLPSLLTLEKLSQCLRVGVGEMLAESSGRPDDQAPSSARGAQGWARRTGSS